LVQKKTKEEIISKASRSLIKDYYVQGTGKPTKGDPNKSLLKPKQAFFDLLALMEDSTFNTEVNVLVDAIMKNGWKIVDIDDPTKRDTKKEKKLETEFRFTRLLRSLYLNLLVYRNTFLEIEYKGKKPKNLHLLETTEMNINVSPHGEILGYTQIHQSGPTLQDKHEIFFNSDEALHIAPSRITTNPWGFVDTRSIKSVVSTKAYLEGYIENLFRENKFRDVWNIENASSTDQVRNFVESLKHGRAYPNKDLVIEGDITYGTLRDTKILQDLMDLHNDYKSMIREFLRVPPLMTGDVGSNKSTGEFEVRFAFDNSVRAWQNIVEDEINNELFTILGWGNLKFQHFPLDKPNETKIIEQAVQLKGLGYDDITINKYLYLKGVELPAGAKIKTPEEIGAEAEAKMGPSNEEVLNQTLQNKNAPSRKEVVKSVDNNKTKEDKTTRDEQMIGKSHKPDFSKYPYIMG